MANIAPGLNFRIGADVKGINKAIREAEKSLRGAVQSFSNIGNSLSLALSAPLVAFGAMAVKTAGEMESLRFALEGTMKDAGRSTADAAKELEALRVAALAPGLDFEQAVRGSVRLQSVGIEAEKAREIIVQLANALALSGGTADQLDGVTKQFTQMIGKGKILQEDISIILENMPALASVMKKEFGQTTAEGLNKAGVSVEQFIQRLTTGMQDLPRATGGISNAITNAVSAVQQALASVGEEINKTFNVSGALNDFSQWVASLAAWFKNLDEGTKRAIAAVAVFAVTLGPAFKLMQGGVWIVGQLQVAFLGLQKVLAQSMAGQAIPSLIAKWKALDVVMKTSVIGATVAVVLALAAAFVVLQKDMSASAQAARKVAETRDMAAASIATERAEIELLTKIAGDEKKGKEERLAAMDKLIAISPTYRSALDGERIDTAKLTAATGALVDSMLRAATAKRAIEDIAAIDEQIRTLAKSSDPSFWQTAGNALLSFNSAAAFGARQAGSAVSNYNEQKKALEATRAELVKLAETNVHVFGTTETTTKGVQKNAAAVEESKSTLDTYLESVKANTEAQKKWNEARAAMGISELKPLEQKAPVLEQADMSQSFSTIWATFDALDMATANVAALGDSIITKLTPAQALIKALSTETLGFGEAWEAVSSSFIENGSAFEGVAAQMINALDGFAESGKDLDVTILRSLRKIIGGLIKTGVAAVVTKALLMTSLNPFAALALGAASGALAQGLFNSIINKVKIPGLAEGGVLTGPQLVMAGEYAGASHNPEIVTPENKMRDVFSEVMRASGGGAGGGALSVRVSGDDLLFVLEKAQTRNGRKR